MPKRRANSRRKGGKPTKISDKANDIGEITPVQVLKMIIEDFEAQVPRVLETVCKKYERECNKVLRQLPDKTCLPSEIYSMTLKEFLENGGSIEDSMKKIRENKRKEFGKETVMKLEESSVKENLKPDDVHVLQTPALRTRSRVQGTARRKPNQLEEVKMVALSKVTGSPVDEKLVMETMIDGMIQGVMKNLLPKITSKTAKAQATKSIQLSLTEMKADLRQRSEVSLVTPSISTDGRRKRKRQLD